MRSKIYTIFGPVMTGVIFCASLTAGTTRIWAFAPPGSPGTEAIAPPKTYYPPVVVPAAPPPVPETPPPLGEKYKPDNSIQYTRIGSLYFPSNSSDLTPEAIRAAAEIVQKLNAKKFTYLSIRGYADAMGSSRQNYNLGMERARKTAEILENMGVPMETAYVGSGGTNKDGPTYDRNRRAEVVAFYTPLPQAGKFSHDADMAAWQPQNRVPWFLILAGILLFLAIVGGAVYVLAT